MIKLIVCFNFYLQADKKINLHNFFVVALKSKSSLFD